MICQLIGAEKSSSEETHHDATLPDGRLVEIKTCHAAHWTNREHKGKSKNATYKWSALGPDVKKDIDVYVLMGYFKGQVDIYLARGDEIRMRNKKEVRVARNPKGGPKSGGQWNKWLIKTSVATIAKDINNIPKQEKLEW